MKKLFFSAAALCLLAGCYEVSNASMEAHSSWKRWEKQELKFRVGKKGSEAENEKKAAYFKACVEKFAPYILKEFEEIDTLMSWKPGTALRINCLGVDYKAVPAPHECTSWLAMPETTAGNEVMLHKNRDSSSRYLTAHRISVPGKYSWIGNCNYGTFAPTSGMNEKALAVVMNSGPRSKGETSMGMGTPFITRIILEQCKSAAEAVKLLEKIVKAKAYNHGSSGSIWFFADPKSAFLVEHDGVVFKAAQVKSGVALRANSWHFPETLVYSKNKPGAIIANTNREYALRDLLVNQILGAGKRITLEDMLKASRIDKFEFAPQNYALCDKLTVVGTTYVLDPEFPEELSYFVSTFGPPRHGLYIPVPGTLKKVPESISSGSWSEKLFKRKIAKKALDMKKLESAEAQMLKKHNAAREEARKVLRAGGFSARKKAIDIMEKAFAENMKVAEKVSAAL